MNTSSGAASGNNPNYEVTNLNVQQTNKSSDLSKPAKFEGTAKINGRNVTVTLNYERGIDLKTAQKDMNVTMQKVAYLMKEKKLGVQYTEAAFKGSEIRLKSSQDSLVLNEKGLTKEVERGVKNAKKEIKDLQNQERKLERQTRKFIRKANPDKLNEAREKLSNTRARLSEMKEKQNELKGYTRVFKNKLPKNTTTDISAHSVPKRPFPYEPKETERALRTPRPVSTKPLPPLPAKLLAPTQSPSAPLKERPQAQLRTPPQFPKRPMPPIPQKTEGQVPTRPIPATPQKTEGQGRMTPPVPTRAVPATPPKAQGQGRAVPQVPNRPIPATPPKTEGQGRAKPPVPNRPIPATPQTATGQARTMHQVPNRPIPATPQTSQGAQFGPRQLRNALRNEAQSNAGKTPKTQTSAPSVAKAPLQSFLPFDRTKKMSEQTLPTVYTKDFDASIYVADDVRDEKKTQFLIAAKEILTTEQTFKTNMVILLEGLNNLELELKKQGKELPRNLAENRKELVSIIEASGKLIDKLETMHQKDGKIHASTLAEILDSPEIKQCLTHLAKASLSNSAVTEEIIKLKSGKTTKKALEAVQQELSKATPLDIDSLIIQPIQRGPRYELLAKEILKAVDPRPEKPETDAGKALEKDIASIKDTITNYNTQIRDRELSLELKLLQRSKLKGGLPILQGKAFSRVRTKNIKPDDFITTLQHLTDKNGTRKYLENRSSEELKAFKDLPKVFNAFKSFAESKFKKELSEEQKSRIDNLIGELEEISKLAAR
ncbi:RhoGEF domain-containing protein [Criblamydia sequanensis]|uniref:DH domain-containing protein n=1 Tax=Candidatus Criblamydia sequanensis CRIB-18 TaxID=1437425 RepID=A0A090D2W9_9BACT|nr:RhoGEF domain-containing protein [Criblamydia sequanensis]CDR35020.1 hypothetical protein CSEC_2214 [Criblamydia sequanensis CRIB-18]